jgi:hypothetical protein
MELWLWTAQGCQTFYVFGERLFECPMQLALDIAIDHIILHTPSPLLSITLKNPDLCQKKIERRPQVSISNSSLRT